MTKLSGVPFKDTFSYGVSQKENFRGLFHKNNSKNFNKFSHETGELICSTSSLVHKFSKLYRDEELSDIEIVVQNHCFNVHKLILCCSSDVFRVMLTKEHWPEAHRRRIVLQEELVCVSVFGDFIRFMYVGQVQLTVSNVLPILMLADKYNVADLRNACLQFMDDHIVGLSSTNRTISWLQYALMSGHRHLVESCQHFLQLNFHKVLSSPDFCNASPQIVKELVHHSELVVPDEYTLFTGIYCWLSNHLDFLSNSSSTIVDIFSLIRFPMMSLTEIAAVHDRILQGSQAINLYLIEMLRLARKYQTYSNLSSSQIELSSCDFDSKHTTPRNYTNDMWSSVLVIDNFCQMPPYSVRTLMFATPISGSAADEHHVWEWNADVYAKGVHLERCIMINPRQNLEVPSSVVDTVRLILTAKSAYPNRRAIVTILVTGVQDLVEYYAHSVKRECSFNESHTMEIFNDIVPFNELIDSSDSKYRSGPYRDSFKITINISPIL